LNKKSFLEQFILFDDLRGDETVRKAATIFEAFENQKNVSRFEAEYCGVQRALLAAGDELAAASGALWQNYIAALVAASENPFSLSAERGKKEPRLTALAALELPLIRKICLWNWTAVSEFFGGPASCVAVWKGSSEVSAKRALLRDCLLIEDGSEADALFSYYERYGSGVIEKYDAFVWNGKLDGVARYDAVSFSQLIGYAPQKEKIIENTAFFVNGLPYNNMLLYGDRGTGKSSCVKALLTAFKERNLKLVSLPRDEIGDLPSLTAALSERGCKFVVFIDDLSFEENERGYKAFKSALEGSVRGQADNVLICATSNRRNIIREVWKEREGQDDINLNDGIQEKRSLADRFGLTVTFGAPDKQAYLEIVRGLAGREGLKSADKLEAEALVWATRQGGRSGRTARQFINYVKGKTASEAIL
jgi:predicted AAA+ superfamily ATPase